MSDLKNQIFTLLKKCPNRANTTSDGGCVEYEDPNLNCQITVGKKFDAVGYFVEVWIDAPYANHFESIDLTEKEFMELKWTMEEYETVLKLKLLDAFKDLCESEPSSMDDLLKDE